MSAKNKKGITMNREQIKQEMEQLKEQRMSIDPYSSEEHERWEKFSNLSSLLRDMENMENCDDELSQIYEMEQQIKELQKKIKETENKIFLKKGFKKDIKFVDKRDNKTCLMVNERMFRVLKKDGTISAKEGAKGLSTYNIPYFEIIGE